MLKIAPRGIEDLRRLNDWRRYQSTLSFILYAVTKKLFPRRTLRIEHSISKGFYCTINDRTTISDLRDIEAEMHSIIRKALSIKRTIYTKPQAIKLFRGRSAADKLILLENCHRQHIPIYELLGFYDTYAMPPYESTGRTPLFYLESFPPGFILMFPSWQDLSRLPEFIPQPKLTRIFNEYVDWARILGIADVGQLNHAIKKGEGPEIIKIVEALHEKKIVYIADRIVKEKKKLILIAGPSSAGKTTFTKRLAIQLLVNGIKPIIISTDDYFLPHSKTPKDEFGQLDFESINAVDIQLLNQHLLRLIEGEKISIPKFNFISGRRNIGKTISLPSIGVVLLEGIHCLNDELTFNIPKSLKFKIYISALTQLNIDNHNRISTTDTRMIRRIVRDTHFRGYRIQKILRLWGLVRRGEEKNIYSYQEEADEMFNSALVYEPTVLRKYCVPIIKRIRKGAPEFEEAQRLIEFLNLFYDLHDRDVPSNSILREFIGGSSFVY